MKQKTAIDWLLDNIPMRYRNAMLNSCAEEIEKAKQMEEKQMKGKTNEVMMEGLLTHLEMLQSRVGMVEVGSIIDTIKTSYLIRDEGNLPEEDHSPYCKICSACGEEGCCSPVMCEQHKDGEYCGSYLRDLKFNYTLLNAFEENIYDKMSDELKKEYDELWNQHFDNHYKKNHENNN